MSIRSSREKQEFGDFQTPLELARLVCSKLHRLGVRPASVLEPTCGAGTFVLGAREAFVDAMRVVGYDVNPSRVAQAVSRCEDRPDSASIKLGVRDFFSIDWAREIASLPPPVLLLGNPPWVTNSELSKLGSANVPMKNNVDGLRGLEALTGSSNFDISEWMLRSLLDAAIGSSATIAVLCKTSVARKVLTYAWGRRTGMRPAALYRIDSKRWFGVSVDACLLLIRLSATDNDCICSVYADLDAEVSESIFGYRRDRLVSNVVAFDRWNHLSGSGLIGWRSGVKHDASSVFELTETASGLVNGLNEPVDLEPAHLYPFQKSSDVAAGGKNSGRWILLPQRAIGEDTECLKQTAPKVWGYLQQHAPVLEQRASSIYRNRPRFSVFGVGPYTFAPWKVAISGLYKKLQFTLVAPLEGKPVVFDDTCYFFPCRSRDEATKLLELVDSIPAHGYWKSLLFWDSKRPITSRLLNSLDLAALANELRMDDEIARALAERQLIDYADGHQEQLLFR